MNAPGKWVVVALVAGAFALEAAQPKAPPTNDEWLPKIEQTEAGPKPPAVTGREKGATAFPQLAVPERNVIDPKGWEKYQADLAKLCPRMLGTHALKIEATDDDLQRVLKARLHRGVIEWIRVRAEIARGSWNANQLSEAFECLTDIQVAATELWSVKPNELIPWLEESVIVAKDLEQFISTRVINGSDTPRRLDAAIRHRLRAEAALLKAKNRA